MLQRINPDAIFMTISDVCKKRIFVSKTSVSNPGVGYCIYGLIQDQEIYSNKTAKLFFMPVNSGIFLRFMGIILSIMG